MQIRKITFKNINNLKGEQEIDFSQHPLSHSGMFAIVGPTGSGKSTILDVITLALFNRIPRFKKPMTKTELEGAGSVMTRHTKSCYAAIEYQIKNEVYTSKWEISTNRNNKLRDYHMEIYSHSAGSFLDLKRSQVPNRNEEIIGLDYDQFIKSIILSQGQFAKFLKADKNERGYLLENITGSKIYRKLGIKAFEKHRAVKAEIDKFKTRKDDIILLPEEEKTVIKATLTESHKIVEEQNRKLKELNTAKQVKQELRKLEAEWSTKKNRYDLLLTQLSEFKREDAKLLSHDLASPYRGKIVAYEMSAHQLNIIEGQLVEYQAHIDNAKKQLAEVVKEMAELTKKPVNEGSFKSEMQAYESMVNSMDNDLKNIREQGTELREQVNLLLDDNATATELGLSPTISPDKAIALLQEQMKELPTPAQENVDVDKQVIALSQEINKLKSELEILVKLAENKIAQETCNTAMTEKSKMTTVLEKELISIRTEEEANQNELKKFSDHKKDLQIQKEKALKLFSLTDYRKDLQDGEACPLCGSESHPYAEHLPDSGNGYDLEIKKTDEIIKKIEKELKHLNSTKVTNQTKIETFRADLKALSIHKQELEKILTILLQSSEVGNLKHKELLHKIESNNKILLQSEEKLAQIISQKEIHTFLSKYQQLTVVTAKYKTIQKQRLDMFKGKNVTTVCNLLQDRFQDCTTSLVSNQQAITNAKQKKKTETKNLNVTDKKLSPILEKIGLESLMQLKALILNDNEVNSIKERKIQLSTHKTELETALKSIKENLKAYRAKDSFEETLELINVDLIQLEKSQKELLTGIGQLTEQLNQDENSLKRIATFQTELDKLEKEQEKWALLHSIIGDAQGNKFANYAQGLTLQNLVVLANKRLKQLSDRYLLTKPESDGQLQVIDLYQGETKRAVSTLSGGESFMVSLALALSLSDMASKNISLDSLFIDEGFGTLDPETLDMAMNTLERLQTESQKTVGVISHVEALKERIHVQIRLVKNSQGYSKIEIAS